MNERRRRLRLLIAAIAIPVVLFGGWRLVRDTPLTAVNDVKIEGVHGSQADQIRAALTRAAQEQSTLHVQEDKLLEAVRSYPVVHSLRAERDLLHGLKIYVNSYDPVAAAEHGSTRVAVAADGTLLRGASTENLARLKVESIGGGKRLDSVEGMRAVRLLAAAPEPLRKRVQRVFKSKRGLSTTLRKGPKLYFGGTSRFEAKWAAASKVLSDSGSLGASYIDLRLPDRPTAGGLPALPPEPKPDPIEVDPALAPTSSGAPTG